MALHPLYGLSLCAGAGGLDLGLHLAEPSAHTVCYVEHDPFAAATLVARMADQSLGQAAVWDDLKSFDGRPWRGLVDVILAGYPCQPFSMAGQRKGTSDPRHLWPYVAATIDTIRPRFVFCENVAGHLTLGFQQVCDDLDRLGYRVAAGLFTAAETSSSHLRERLFFLAYCTEEPVANPGSQQFQQSGGIGLSGAAFSPPPLGKSGQTQQWLSNVVAEGNRAGDVVPQPVAGVGGQITTAPPSLYPPGPDELDDWLGITTPALQPAIRGVDDGLAYRLDRSRLIGNGVCPMAAAYAWRTLKAALMEGEASKTE